jgi:uncharacterized protein (DUF1015 family)
MKVKPFKAFRFNEAMVGDVGSCIAPPYDVISPAQQDLLYQKNEYNIVRITKGKTTPADSDTNNQYTRAADYLHTWIEKGVLKQDSAETIYAYVQDFQLAGKNFHRTGFIALAGLEDFGKTVRPHEQTLNGPKADRLNLERATKAKFGLVFMLYQDQKKIADRIIENAETQKPLIDFIDEQNVRHRLFAITDKKDIVAIEKLMLDKSCIIADGHHRYETALNYYRETANPAAAYQMTAFVNARQDGLVILAAHRLVGNLENLDTEKFIATLKENFKVTDYRFDSPQARADAKRKMLAQMKTECELDKNAFGIYTGDNAFYVAVLKNKHAMDSLAPNMSSPWKSLDVSVLHKLILEAILGIGEKLLATGGKVEYVKDSENAVDILIEEIDTGRKQLAFFMNPAKMHQIEMVTAAGEKMPQKSTFFYPKMYTGLTINKL